MEALEFLDGPQCRRNKASLLAHFYTLVDQKLEDDVLGPKPLKKTKVREFIKGPVRLFCFADGNAWVLTHGDLKKSAKTPRSNITRAETIMGEDLARRQS